MRDDPVISHYLQDVLSTLEQILTDPEFSKRGVFMKEKAELIRRGRPLYGSKFLILTSRAITCFRDFFDGLMSDETTVDLAQDLIQLNRDLFIDQYIHASLYALTLDALERPQ